MAAEEELQVAQTEYGRERKNTEEKTALLWEVRAGAGWDARGLRVGVGSTCYRAKLNEVLGFSLISARRVGVTSAGGGLINITKDSLKEQQRQDTVSAPPPRPPPGGVAMLQ